MLNDEEQGRDGQDDSIYSLESTSNRGANIKQGNGNNPSVLKTTQAMI